MFVVTVINLKFHIIGKFLTSTVNCQLLKVCCIVTDLSRG